MTEPTDSQPVVGETRGGFAWRYDPIDHVVKARDAKGVHITPFEVYLPIDELTGLFLICNTVEQFFERIRLRS